MAKRRRKSKARADAIVVSDVVFGTLVHDEVAVIHAEQGIVVLMSKEDGHAYPVPAGIPIKADLFGQEVDITVRDITGEVILELASDDYYEDDLKHEDDLLLVESTLDLEEIYNERKIQLFTRMAGLLSTFVGGCTLTGMCIWLLGKPFPFTYLLYAGIVAGVSLGIIFGLVPSFRGFRKLSSKYVADNVGNWVNMETGQTNLNGGMILPTKKG